MMKNPHVDIFDTTLRDGEQSPGAALNVDQRRHTIALAKTDTSASRKKGAGAFGGCGECAGRSD